MYLYAFASTEPRARTIFGIDATVRMEEPDLPLTQAQRAEWGEYAKCYAVHPNDLAVHWAIKNKQANRLIDDATV